MREFIQSVKTFFGKPLLQQLEDAERTPDPSLILKVMQAIKEGESSIELLRRYLALQYRSQDVERMIQKVDTLYALAIAWKKARPLLGHPCLSPREMIQLKEASKYPEFVALLDDSSLKDTFFEWVLQDGNDSAPFIEFPATCDRLIAAKLSGRISHNGICYLKILREGSQKILALPFEGQLRNILDPEAKVSFRGNYVLSMQEIFDIFSNKEVEVGNLEFLNEGIVNWNIHKLGYWNAAAQKHVPIDISQEEWWSQMPLLEILNRKQVLKRYGLALKENEWIASPVATRGNPNLDFNATHAFIEIVIPRKGDYAVYNFGKLATVYPATAFDRIKMLTKTVHATVAYPDDTSYYRHRQRGFYPFILKREQGGRLMDLIKEDIQVARNWAFDYQIQSENCAKWVFHKLEDVLGRGKIPDFFRMQLLDTEPGGIVRAIFNWIKKLPERWQVPVLMFCHIPLGAHRTLWIEERGMWTPKSLHRHSFFKTGQIYLPALLVHKVMQITNTIFFKTNIKSKLYSLLSKFFKCWRNMRCLKFFLRKSGTFFTPIL